MERKSQKHRVHPHEAKEAMCVCVYIIMCDDRRGVELVALSNGRNDRANQDIFFSSFNTESPSHIHHRVHDLSCPINADQNDDVLHNVAEDIFFWLQMYTSI